MTKMRHKNKEWQGKRRKVKVLGVATLLTLTFSLSTVSAQTMYVKEKSSTQTAYALSSLRKMTFTGGNATVQKTDNSTTVYALNGLRYLNFTDLTTSITANPMQLGNDNLFTYPNPVNDLLTIDLTSVATGGTISILTLDGKVLQAQKTDGSNTAIFNLSQLPQGIYLCRYESTKAIKTVKIIKQ